LGDRENAGFESARDQRHGAQDSDRSGSQDDRPQTGARLGGIFRRDPWQSPLDFPHLRERFFRDCQRLGQDGHVAQFRRHGGQVCLGFGVELGQEAMPHLYASFGELAGRAEILATASAWKATLLLARTPDGRNHQIAHLELGYATADFDDLAEVFVSNDQIIAACGGDP